LSQYIAGFPAQNGHGFIFGNGFALRILAFMSFVPYRAGLF